jgi:hypothetical protein
MKVYDNPFLKDQTMVDAKLFKGKTKVLNQLRPEKSGQLIQRYKYQLMSIEKLKGIMTNKRTDMSREKHQELVP